MINNAISLLKLWYCICLFAAYTGVYAQLTFSDEKLIAQTEVLYPTTIKAADLTGNGFLDLVVLSNEGSELSWFKNNGGNDYGKIQLLTTAYNLIGSGSIINFHFTDIDTDGDQDLLVQVNNTALWLPNNGDGSFGTQQIISASGQISAFHVTDFNTDGHQDLLLNLSGNIVWFTNNGAGNFTLQQTFNIATGAKKVIAADINNDGLLDLVFASSESENAGTLGWFRNIGEGVFNTTLNPIAYWAGIEDFDIADIDNDGLPDVLAVSTYYNTSGWFKNFENGVYFEERLICNCHTSPICITTADFDNDGDFDVVVGTRAGRIVSWYENDSAGNFEPADINISEIIEPKAIRVADINNDGYKDVVVGFSSQSQILWYKNLFLNIAAPSNEVEMPEQTQILHLAPNPTQNTLALTYTTPDAQPLALHLYDLAGKVVYSQANLPASPGIHTATLQLQQLPKGMYLLTLFSAQTALRAKVVKE